MAHEFGEIILGLRGLLVCKFNINAGSFEGGVANLDSDQMLTVESEGDTDELRDSGKIARLLAVMTKANITITQGGIDFSALAVLTGASTETSGSTPNRRRRMKLKAGNNLPYFGIIGEAYTDDGGVVPVGLKVCKLNKYPTITMDGTENKFQISEMEGTAICAPDDDDLIYIETQETLANWTRPTDATEFGAFFWA